MAKTPERQLGYQKKYDLANRDKFKNVFLKLNKEADADILEKLAATDNVQGYIKSLIRADICNKTVDKAEGGTVCF